MRRDKGTADADQKDRIGGFTMTCPNCNNVMRKGFLFTSKDGAFSFADEVPGVFHNAKKAEGFIEITPLEASHRVSVEAYCCEACRLVQFTY